MLNQNNTVECAVHFTDRSTFSDTTTVKK